MPIVRIVPARDACSPRQYQNCRVSIRKPTSVILVNNENFRKIKFGGVVQTNTRLGTMDTSSVSNMPALNLILGKTTRNNIKESIFAKKHKNNHNKKVLRYIFFAF